MGGAVLGALLRAVLPKHHVTDESKDVIKVGIGLIATLAALVLGLLIASAKSSFDTKSAEVKDSAAKIILLDRTLRQYGRDATPIRELIQRLLASKVNLTWLENDRPPATQVPAEGAPAAGSVEE